VELTWKQTIALVSLAGIAYYCRSQIPGIAAFCYDWRWAFVFGLAGSVIALTLGFIVLLMVMPPEGEHTNTGPPKGYVYRPPPDEDEGEDISWML